MMEAAAGIVFIIGLIVSILHGIPNSLFEEEFVGTFFVMALIIILFH